MATILSPFRVAFMPEPELIQKGEFRGHQRVPSDIWDGFATAEEALDRAEALNGDSTGTDRDWVAVEIREVVRCGDYPAPCNCDDPITHNGH